MYWSIRRMLSSNVIDSSGCVYFTVDACCCMQAVLCGRRCQISLSFRELVSV